MSDFEAKLKEYVNDKRIACKYVDKCYQKNPAHHEKYKHPPKKGSGIPALNNKRIPKKLPQPKARHDVSDSDEDSGTETKPPTGKHDISDSDSENSKNSSDSENKKVLAKPTHVISDSDEDEDNSTDDENKKLQRKANHEVSESDQNSSDDENNRKRSHSENNSDSDKDVISATDESDTEENRSKKRKIDQNKDPAKIETIEPKSNKESPKKESPIKDSPKKDKARVSDENKRSVTYLEEKSFIKSKFLVDMPKDFYEFWDFCKNINKNNPLQALVPIGLKLVGPFDVLAGKFNDIKDLEDEKYLLHWRYFHDTPELQTVLRGDDKTGYHIGYWTDDPKEPPVFMVNNHANKNGVISQMGENIFAAVNLYLDELNKSGDPFKKMNINRIKTPLLAKAKELKLDISPRTNKMVARERKVVTKTFNKIGLVVPYNKKSELGYRELALSNKDLLAVLNKLSKAQKTEESKYLSELQPCITFASIALDECDFGTGIELGWNIIAHGVESLNSTALRFLQSSYSLLNREPFVKIAEAHLKNRKKGSNLSII